MCVALCYVCVCECECQEVSSESACSVETTLINFGVLTNHTSRSGVSDVCVALCYVCVSVNAKKFHLNQLVPWKRPS